MSHKGGDYASEKTILLDYVIIIKVEILLMYQGTRTSQ